FAAVDRAIEDFAVNQSAVIVDLNFIGRLRLLAGPLFQNFVLDAARQDLHTGLGLVVSKEGFALLLVLFASRVCGFHLTFSDFLLKGLERFGTLGLVHGTVLADEGFSHSQQEGIQFKRIGTDLLPQV